MSTHRDAIRILHVDDNPDIAAMTETFLERENERFTVETMTNTREALNRVAANPPDCIVSDYDMPGLNGLEFLEAIREDYPELPFILFTGKGSEEVASDAISAGVTDYLQKESATSQYAVLANRILNAVEGFVAQQERQRHLDAIETAQEGISILDEDRFVYVNEAYATLYGYDPEEMLGEHWSLIYPEEEVPEARDKILPEVMETGHWHGKTTGLRKDGSTFVEDHTLALTEGGELVCTVRDITEREQQQKRLENTLTRLELAVEGANLGVWDWDMRTDRVKFNERWAEILGHTLDEIEPRLEAWETRVHPADLDDVEAALQAHIDGETQYYDTEHRMRTADGNWKWIRDIGKVLERNDVGEAIRAAGIHLDITEQKERELELDQEKKRLEEFTSVVSHDLRNPLGVAKGRVELARDDCENEHLEAVEAALDRMDELINDLLLLARSGDHIDEMVPVELPTLVESCWRNVETADATIRTETDLTIRADRSRVSQLLENLFRNAIEHGGENVTVTVGELEDGFYVADDGPGIPDDEQDAVFEVGYSTLTGGTGFGLSIVNQVVKAHGWSIHVTDSSNRGARFEILGVDCVDG